MSSIRVCAEARRTGSLKSAAGCCLKGGGQAGFRVMGVKISVPKMTSPAGDPVSGSRLIATSRFRTAAHLLDSCETGVLMKQQIGTPQHLFLLGSDSSPETYPL